MSAHSYWPASGMEQRILCAGSHVLQQGQPDNANSYAAEGTAAHQVLTWAGQRDKDAADFIGRVIRLDEGGRVIPDAEPGRASTYEFCVDDAMAEHVQVCLDYVREVAGDNPVLYDVKVNYATYLGVPEDEAWGTADVIILLPDEIVVVDFKYGMGVEVSAGEDGGLVKQFDDAPAKGEHVAVTSDDPTLKPQRKPNPQMGCYGLGALTAYRDFADFQRARLVISQPRMVKAPSEYDLSIADLEAWAEAVVRRAVGKCQDAAGSYTVVSNMRYWEEGYLKPGEKQCRFCKAKATCPALRNEVASTVFGSEPANPEDFAETQDTAKPEVEGTEANWLSACLQKVDLIEDWCKGIRAEVERRLLAGESVPDFKIVAGKRGNRQFRDEAEAEAALKSMRLKLEEMYDLKLISPTTAEKRAKAGVIGPRQWTKLQELIVQREGKPHVAHVSDPRPALTVQPVADEFQDVTQQSQDGCAWIR